MLVAAAIAKGEPPESVMAARRPQKANASAASVTVAAAIEALEHDYWATCARTSASERSWARLRTELNRLPPGATLTPELLDTNVVPSTQAGVRAFHGQRSSRTARAISSATNSSSRA